MCRGVHFKNLTLGLILGLCRYLKWTPSYLYVPYIAYRSKRIHDSCTRMTYKDMYSILGMPSYTKTNPDSPWRGQLVDWCSTRLIRKKVTRLSLKSIWKTYRCRSYVPNASQIHHTLADFCHNPSGRLRYSAGTRSNSYIKYRTYSFIRQFIRNIGCIKGIPGNNFDQRSLIETGHFLESLSNEH